MDKKFIAPIIHVIKKLTLLDWIICVVILGFAIFFMVNRLSKKTEWVSLKLKVSNDEWWYNSTAPENWYASGISKGQFAYNTFGKKVAEIQSVENYDAGGANRLIFVNLKVLTTYNKSTHTYTFNYQALQVGKALDFTFDKYNLHGLVTYIGNSATPYTDMNIEVKLLAVFPWEAASYSVGDQAKDTNGNVISTIREVSVVDATTMLLSDYAGRLIAIPTSNDTRKDVTLRITLKTYRYNNEAHYIDGTAIKIGNHIWLEYRQTAAKDAIISTIY